MKNDFSVDTSKKINNDFMRKVKGPMNIALLLTGIQTLCAIIYVIGGIVNKVWKNEGIGVFFAEFVSYLNGEQVTVQLPEGEWVVLADKNETDCVKVANVSADRKLLVDAASGIMLGKK